MKRDTTQTIWRTVVFAGAMLGAGACSKPKPAPTTPQNTAAAPNGGEAQMVAPNGKPATTTGTADPCAGDANPCGAPDPRPRGTDDDNNGGGTGRGFVLS